MEGDSYMLVIRPTMNGDYPSMCSLVRDCLLIWRSDAEQFLVPNVFFMYKQESYKLFVAIVDALKTVEKRTMKTEVGEFWCIGPMKLDLLQTIREELGDGLEDAGIFPRKRRF